MASTRRVQWLASACAATVSVTALASALWQGSAESVAGADTGAPGAVASPVGEWGFHLAARVGALTEDNVGILDLRPEGTCTLRMRSNFNGAPHDHEATSCSWSSRPVVGPARPGVDGAVTVTGVAEPGPSVISFVLADRGERLLLMLDDTPPGVTGSGEAFRR